MNLGVGGLGLRLRTRQLGLGLAQPCRIVGIVDLDQQIALLHDLVFLDANCDNLSGHACSHRDNVGRDLGIVGLFLAGGSDEVRGHAEEHGADDRGENHEGSSPIARSGRGSAVGRAV